MRRFTPRAGVTLPELLVAMAIIAILLAILVPAVQKVRAAMAQTECQNKMKQVALATHAYHTQHQHFPPALSMNTQEHWYLSWMGRILPQLGEAGLAQGVTDEYARTYSPWGLFWQSGWGGQPPHSGLSAAPAIFRCPVDGRNMVANLELGTGNAWDVGFTTYVGVNGTDTASNDGVFVVGSRIMLNSITDGASNTIFIGERPPFQDWRYGMWYAGAGYDGKGTGDVVLGAREVEFATVLGCPNTKVGLQPGHVGTSCDQSHFWSWHSGGGNFAFADGSVRYLSFSVDAKLAALATRAGGEAVNDD
jgi:prepilin-type N-terminal cleavage/methylation domain-containing protein/prepilin-type processing-associated H-X9-DG protein